MSHTYEKLSSNKAKLTIVVSAEKFDEAMHKAYLKTRNQVTIPGFRKGKAPRKMIENMYGEAIFYDDAIEAVFPEAYEAAVKEFDLKPVDRPEVDVKQIGAGQDLEFTVEVFVRPDVELGDYKALTVEVAPKHEVTDRAVEDGDTVNLDYAGSVDGVAFQGGTAQGQTLTIGSHQFIPGFEEQMVGMAIGEEKDLNVQFPEQYHAEDLAGKDAVFHVKVNAITKTELPELDDDFAQDNNFDTFEDYRASIVKELSDRVERNYEISVENALVEKATANATIDMPKAMIEDQANYILRDMEIRMMYQGLRMEDYLKYTGQTREQLAESYYGEAEQRARVELTMEAIRKAEAIEPTEEEVAEQIAKQAEQMGQEVETFEKSLTDEQRSYLVDTAAIQKVVNFLKEGVTVVAKEEAKAEDAE